MTYILDKIYYNLHKLTQFFKSNLLKKFKNVQNFLIKFIKIIQNLFMHLKQFLLKI